MAPIRYRRRQPVRPRKKMQRRVFRKKTIPRAPSNMLLYKRRYSIQTLAPNALATAGFWQYYTFQPSVLPNWSELASLFEFYKLAAIKYTYYPKYDSVDAATAAPIVYGTYQVNPTSTLVPTGTYNRTTLNNLMENFNTKTVRLDKPISIYYRPKLADDINTVTGVKFINPMIATSTGGNQFFRGHHMFFHDANFSSTGLAAFTCEQVVTVYFKLKKIK